jgi:phosphomannomutase/phosphoglucomutase
MVQIFGTSGVRGFTNSEMTPQLILELAQSYGTVLGAGTKVATGRDTRYGAQMLESAAMAGLMSAGLHVESCGVVPMAAMASYIINEKLGGGVLITGSHMPPDRIGLILMNSEGAYTPYSVSDEVEKIYAGRNWARAPYEKVGRSAHASKPLERYIGRVGKMVNRRSISLNRFKVLVDTGNGTAGAVLPRLLRDLCCDVECLHHEPKPNPDRDCEPRAATLKATAQRARELRVQLTAATDLDADRVVFFDERAEGIPEDVAGCIFARYVLSKRKGPIVVPVNSSILIERVCKDAGVPLHYCRVGQPSTMEAIKKHGAVFSYEESGKYYFVKDEFWCDGILATMKLLEVMAARKCKASELVAEFPPQAQVKYKLPCPDTEKQRIYPAVKELLSSHPFEEPDRLIDLDGLKTIYKSGSWLLIRVSGTEPLVRVFAEAAKEEAARELADYGMELVKSVLNK